MFQKNNSSVEPQKLQNNVLEKSVPALERNIIEESSRILLSCWVDNLVIEDSSSYDNEILRVKNIFKIGTPLPLEPSLYSPIHHNCFMEKAK